MNNKVKLIISIVLCVVLFGGAMLLYNNLKDKPTTKPAPEQTTQVQNQQEQESTTENKYVMQDITFYDENNKPVKLSDFKGKKVVLNMWATWCGYCKQEMPEFQEAYNKYKNDVQFIMLNVEDRGADSMSIGKEYIAQTGYTFPVFYDIDMQSNAYMNLTRGGIPATFFIDEEGNLVAMQPGMMNASMLEQGMQILMEG